MRRPKRSWGDRVEMARDAWALARIELGLRRRTMSELATRLGMGWQGGAQVPDPEMDALPGWAARRYRIALAVCARWPFGDTCLRRSLLIGHRLRALEPVLRIGVDPTADALSAHAWLEIKGRSLDPESTRFATLRAVGDR